MKRALTKNTMASVNNSGRDVQTNIKVVKQNILTP